jgi:hypothetical protein
LIAEEPVHGDLKKRSVDAVLQRYKKVRAEALKFEGFLKIIRSGRPTGDPRTEYMERVVTAMYNGRAEESDMYSYMTENPADPGREFPFLKCLYYLRTATQWRMMQGWLMMDRPEILEMEVAVRRARILALKPIGNVLNDL